MNREKIENPPEKLRDVVRFGQGMAIAYPFYLTFVAYLSVAPEFQFSALWNTKTLTLVGLISEFFAGGLLVWEALHLPAARAKLAECQDYENKLNQAYSNRNVKNHEENLALRNLIAQKRQILLQTLQGAQQYEHIRYKMALCGFIVFGIGTALQMFGQLTT